MGSAPTWPAPPATGNHPPTAAAVRVLQNVRGTPTASAAEAVAWGLATEAVAGDAFAARLTELEDELVAGPAHTYGPTKALARGADVEALRAHVRQEAASIAAASEHPEAVRRVEAFAGR